MVAGFNMLFVNELVGINGMWEICINLDAFIDLNDSSLCSLDTD